MRMGILVLEVQEYTQVDNVGQGSNITAATITLCVCIVVCASVDNKLHDVTCLCVDYKHMYCFVYVQDTLPQSQTLMASWKHHNKPKSVL